MQKGKQLEVELELELVGGVIGHGCIGIAGICTMRIMLRIITIIIGVCLERVDCVTHLPSRHHRT